MMPRPRSAKTILDMETKLGGGGTRSCDTARPNVSDHKTTFAQLEAMAPHIRWSDYFEHLQLPKDVALNVQEPKFSAGVDRQMQSVL